MNEKQALGILKNILPEQKSKMLNRIYFTLAWMLIPLLLLVINTLTLTIHLVDNPVDLVIFFYFLLLGFCFWGLGIIGQNYFGWKTLNQLSKKLTVTNLNLDELNQIKTSNYFFNPYYKTINQQLGIILHYPQFCAYQNNQSLKKQNYQVLLVNLVISLLVISFITTESLHFQSFDLTQWTLIFGLVLLIIYFGLLLPWIIFRQINLNFKYHHYLNQELDSYQFIFTHQWLLLKSTCEKLEVENGN